MDRPHKILVAFQYLVIVENRPCLTPSSRGILGDLVKKIVENNNILCSLNSLSSLIKQKGQMKYLHDAIGRKTRKAMHFFAPAGS
jgi:hypothetical protein